MKPYKLTLLCLLTSIVLLTKCEFAFGQFYAKDSLNLRGNFLSRLISDIDRKRQLIERATEKHLRSSLRSELRIYRILSKKDSILAKSLYPNGVECFYLGIDSSIKDCSKSSSVYLSKVDSISTAISFFQIVNGHSLGSDFESVSMQYKLIGQKLNSSFKIEDLLKARRKWLSDRLKSTPYFRLLDGIKSKAYYFRSRLSDYKQYLEQPSKWERLLLDFALSQPGFKAFFQSSSQLGTIFNLPLSNQPNSISLQGLQTRDAVQGILTRTFGSISTASTAFEGGIATAESELSSLKQRLNLFESGGFTSTGRNSDDIDLPQGFRPNNQKTRSFFKRLEFGFNLQNKKANSIMPISTDFGLSLGFKFSDRFVLGIGSSYVVSWGEGLARLRVRSEGASLRSFIDYKFKGQIYVSGGYELNYRPLVVERVEPSVLSSRRLANWTRSGLIGLSKRYKVGKVNTEIKVLWDFLSYRQVPQPSPIVFRLGWRIK